MRARDAAIATSDGARLEARDAVQALLDGTRDAQRRFRESIVKAWKAVGVDRIARRQELATAAERAALRRGEYRGRGDSWTARLTTYDLRPRTLHALFGGQAAWSSVVRWSLTSQWKLEVVSRK